eukprot:8837561-Pyramimonas_sp.AAC.1
MTEPAHSSEIPPAYLAHCDVRYASPMGRLMMGSERLRSTIRVFQTLIPPLRAIINELMRHKGLIDMQLAR